MSYLLTSESGAATGKGLTWGKFAVASNLRSDGPHVVPVSIPRDQVYYWSHRWQESERKAREDLANGRSRVFSDPTEAVRHLLQ